MSRISPIIISVTMPFWIFLVSSFIWYLVLYQAISFFSGIAILIFLIFLTFWQIFLSFRRKGELIGLKNKKQIIVVSLVFVLGFSELIWSISFMPFSFFILGGILAVIFGVVLDIYKEYFKKSIGDNLNIKRILIRDVVTGVILIAIFIFISPWLPPKVS